MDLEQKRVAKEIGICLRRNANSFNNRERSNPITATYLETVSIIVEHTSRGLLMLIAVVARIRDLT
jgi:hypothetical protein